MAKKNARGAPSKACPKCTAQVHARTGTCPGCGHKFQKKTPVKPAAVKAAKPAKKPVVTPDPSGFGQYLAVEMACLEQQKADIDRRLDACQALLQAYGRR